MKQLLFSKWGWCAGVVLITALVLWPCLYNGWVTWDDPAYILDNMLVHSISWQQVSDIFTTPQVNGSYNPLVLLSWAIDWRTGNGSPFPFHITNLLLHLLNTALVFVLAGYFLKSYWQSACVALLFGIHPMHVETVAWISSRKDLLMTAFYLASLISYARWHSPTCIHHGWKRHLSLVFFVPALLSKGVAITLPVVLLLIDYVFGRRNMIQMSVRKTAYWILAFLFIWISYAGQEKGHALDHFTDVPSYLNVFVASHNLLTYLFKCIVPIHLSAYHPFPPSFYHGALPWHYYLASLLVLALMYLGYRWIRQKHMAGFGLAFFMLTIAPTLQLIPFGITMQAERFTYLPYFGLFVAGMAQLKPERFIHNPLRKQLTWGLIGVCFLCLAWISNRRATVWKNGKTLWTAVIQNDPDHFFGYGSLALYYDRTGRRDMALNYYNKSIELDSTFVESRNNRGMAYKAMGRYGDAMNDYNTCIRIDSTFPNAYTNRALLWIASHDYDKALADLNHALKLEKDPITLFNRGHLYHLNNQPQQALSDLNEAIDMAPAQGSFYQERALTRLDMNEPDVALLDFSKALELNPSLPISAYRRGCILMDRHQLKEALADFNKTIQLNPHHTEAYVNRGLIYLNTGKLRKSLSDLNMAVESDSTYALGYYNRALLFKEMGEQDLAIQDFSRYLNRMPKDIPALQERAALWRAMGRFDMAMQDVETALSFNPTSPVLYEMRAMLYDETGRPALAAKDRERQHQLTQTR
ncbi:MAG: tetratricopeptide repeat protein [Flavobacteriales bacterium]|nr:tetratricopeptide repeat protein [Flavobacteriales bacterium]MCB9448102.1 tetratricopeptide repeat protein [Flavobacteriales bacterium]